ncbi:DUF808 domain-containing protein [Methylobacterium nodulans]|uniref:ABC transporter n=1 Tax=Methylobacterium nodulans (strain LMG 21967 / CNCM I-2342 / ORS 2060) TaxID=460265 RepID=B8IG37_METNO|nr:DUF808 domain-containing protein [Methylobacterium nodulans]ACL61514.1 protein of unknown function DUF808 [Methylobacterium nodulans ORS 2060]
MATGLIALIDDIAGLAKMAAASLDDAASQAARASAKAAGVVIDDTAVTPRYVVGLSASRELPIIGKIALGSLKNKLLFLLPGALALSFLAPWLLTPLLMIGGAYLCFEGAEKVHEALWPHAAHAEEAEDPVPRDPKALEDEKVRSTIKTDFILSAEIMALTLATVSEARLGTQIFVLAAVGIGITALVYGVVALIVKADDVGLALARESRPASSLLGLRVPPRPSATPADRALALLTRGLGRGMVRGMPVLLRGLGIVGTAAMIWVGGGIIVHGLESFGLAAIGHAIEHAAQGAADAVPAGRAAAEWTVTAALSGLLGLLVGALVIPLARHVVTPALASLRAIST